MKKRSNRKCGSDSADSQVCLCPLEGIIDVISRKWTLQIIAIIGNDKNPRYNGILMKLGNVSPKILADRLKELEEWKLIERKAYAEIPPRVEYSLTENGKELRNAIMPLMKWVSKTKVNKVRDKQK
jgi:DNA-binding HxlR family transcriptional regulator